MSLQISPSAPPTIVERFDPFSAELSPRPLSNAARTARDDAGVLLKRSRSLGRHELRGRPAYPEDDEQLFRAGLAAAAHRTMPARGLAIETGRLRCHAGADQSRSARPCAPTPPGERRVYAPTHRPGARTLRARSRTAVSRRALSQRKRRHSRRPRRAFPALVLFQVLGLPEFRPRKGSREARATAAQ